MVRVACGLAERRSTEHYVVLADGVQAVGEVAADLVRFAYDRTLGAVPTVAPAAIAATPVVTTLPVETFPRHARAPVGADDGLVGVRNVAPRRARRASNTVVTTG